MPCIKFLIFLIIATFTLDISRAGFISIRKQNEPLLLYSYDLKYNLDGEHSSKSTPFQIINGSRTLDIPNEATNITLTVYGKSPTVGIEVLFLTQFYSSSIERCFVVNGYDFFEEFCQKLSPVGPYSISVERYSSVFPVLFHLSYQCNGSNFKEITTYFQSLAATINGVNIAQIPNGATNINFTIQMDTDIIFRHDVKKPFSLTKLYSAPVKKCFVVYTKNQQDVLWFEKPCIQLPAVNGNLISVDTNDCRAPLRMTVTYQYEGSNFSETIYMESRGTERRTFRIPDLASNIGVIIYKYNENPYESQLPEEVFTKFYPSPVAKCIRVNACGRNDIAYEKSCNATKHGYFISLKVPGDYDTYVVFEVTFTYNGMNITESSGQLSESVFDSLQKSVVIPDEATNIRLVIYKYPYKSKKYEIVFSETYSNPVKKCFQLYKSGLLIHQQITFPEFSSGNLADLGNDKEMTNFSC